VNLVDCYLDVLVTSLPDGTLEQGREYQIMPSMVPVRTHILSSSQLAKRLKITKKTLDRMIKDGRIPKPNRFAENNWRFWTLQDAVEIENMLKEEE
jgi:predicted DNA-binding transcriptional regulator AlpA